MRPRLVRPQRLGLDLDVFWGVMRPDEGASAASRRSMLAHLPGLPAVPPTISSLRPPLHRRRHHPSTARWRTV